MTYEETAAGAALYFWLADQPRGGNKLVQKRPRLLSERDKAIFMAGHVRGQHDERKRTGALPPGEKK